MASIELQKNIATAERLINERGHKLEYADALFKYGAYIFQNENDPKTALYATTLAKDCLQKFVQEKTGGTIWQLEKYCRDNDINYDVLDNFYDILFTEAQNGRFDSYMLYLEKDRELKDRFYKPKMKCFDKIGIVKGLQQALDRELDILSISLPPGTGKASKLSAKVLTPSGFVEMRDIHVGDEVIAGSGKRSKVLGVFPQGKLPTYRVTVDDGSSTEVSGNHLWTVQTRDDRRRGQAHRVVTTDDMMSNLFVENGRRANYSIDYVPRIEFDEKDFYIHPYVMGAILGDGGISGNSVILSTPDKELLDKVNELVPNGYKFEHKQKYDYVLHGFNIFREKYFSRRNMVRVHLEEMGLQGCHSHEKFIPSDYLYASYEQRLWLLRGLLDTDGFANGKGVEYSTSSKQLSEDVKELVHSLGGYCSVSEKNTGYKNKDGEYVKCKLCYRMQIQFTSEHESPFYISRKRDAYKPKRSVIKRFVKSIEYIGDEECQCIYIDDPTHLYITDDYILTHNTTLSKFFISFVMGLYPKDYNLFFSHSADICRMYYDGVLSIITDSEYRWADIFPNSKVTSTNAKMMSINLDAYKPFQNLMCGSRGSELAGKVRCNRFLMVDDLIGKQEEALNRNTLDKIWANDYATDAVQRMKEGTGQILIGTRWSVFDPIGRLQEIHKDNPRAKFIAVSATDKVTGESNFLYEHDGFSTEFFHHQQLVMDDITYRCLYDNEPVEREGLLYHEDELRTFTELPEREPDAILAVCDTKSKGTDFLVLPVMYQYDNDYYMVDCICSDASDYGIQYGRMANLICEHNVQQCEFESNAGGDRVAFEVDKLVKERGCRCNITTKPTETNKETRIIVNADWIKRNVLFRQKEDIKPKTDYARFMDFVLTYSVTGKNRWDDVVDALANFALFVANKYRIRETVIRRSPIW